MSRVQVSEAVKIQNGFAFDSELFLESRVGLPVARIRDVLRGYSETYYAGECPKEYEIGNGDLLIGMDGEFNVGVWRGGRALLNQRVCKIIPKDTIADKHYLRHRLALLVKQIEAKTPYVTVKHLSSEELKAEEIELPSLAEQKRIAAILEKADRLHRMRRYASQLSDTFLQSVFLEMFESFLIKEQHEVLKNVLALPLSNGSFENNKLYGSGTPVIWVDNLYHTITIDLSHLRRARLSDAAIAKYQVLNGDLLFTRSSLVREGIGQINIVPKLPERTAFECHIIRARVDEKKVNPFYVLGLYRSLYGRNFIMRRANTATMTTISQTAIEELPCPIPPLPPQEKFAAIVQRFERLCAQQREAGRQAEHLFQTLLHRAFSDRL